MRLRQNGHHFPDDSLKYVSLNENLWILDILHLSYMSNLKSIVYDIKKKHFTVSNINKKFQDYVKGEYQSTM